MRREAVIGVVLVAVLTLTSMLTRTCHTSAHTISPPTAGLAGLWVVDLERLDELREVSVAATAVDRERALARAREASTALRVTFRDAEVTLATRSTTRTVAYRVLGVQGPMLTLEGRHGALRVTTQLRLDTEGAYPRLTWFDSDGEVEYVLRRAPEAVAPTP